MRLHLLAPAVFGAWASFGLAATPAHPRILVTAEDLPRLRAQASDTGKNALGYVPAEAWSALQERADQFVEAPAYHYAVTMPGREGAAGKRWEYTLSDEPPPRHDDFPHYPPWTAMFQERADSITTRLRYLLAAFVVTGDMKYVTRAKTIVLHLCAWPGVWTDPSYGSGQPCLDTGHAAMWVGIFYDWCYERLTEPERVLVRTALMEKALAPINEVMDGISPYHNYTAVIANGLCLGALALLGEEPRAQQWVDHAIERVALNFDAQGRDGGAMEGPMYGTYAADQFADTIWALTTARVPNLLVEHNYIKTLPRYCISLLCPNTRQQPCFGDGGPSVGFSKLMLTLALRGDSDAAWYCRQINGLVPDTVRRFLALDPDRVRPRQPTLNPSDCFIDVGYAILRDAYEPGSAFMAFKSGPPDRAVGHNHLDHNSFVISYAGVWIGWDPGYRSYWQPRERKYTTSTLGHSSIVLDLDDDYLANTTPQSVGHDQMELSGGRIREFFTSTAFDYVLGAAACTYNTKADRVLDQFDRQIVFAKPNVFFIRDSLVAPDEHTYSFLLHLPPGGEFKIGAQGVRAEGAQCLLQADVYSPAGIEFAAATYAGAERRGPYLAATTGKARATVITTALVPRRHSQLIANPGFENGKAGWRPRNMPGFAENHVIDTERKHGGSASARIDSGGYYYSRQFSVPPGTILTARWWAQCTATEGASSRFYYWRNGTSFARAIGPVANVDAWRQYEFTDTVPEGTEEVCLALEFFGTGCCWYDDVDVTADTAVPESGAARVTPLEGGASGVVVEVDGVTHILVCGAGDAATTHAAAGHKVTTDAELTVVSVRGGVAEAFIVRGSEVSVDGRALKPVDGVWREGPSR